jgi:predicted membrane protein
MKKLKIFPSVKDQIQTFPLSPEGLILTVLAIGLFIFHSHGFCDASADLEAQATTLMDKIYGKPLRLIALLFGITFGAIRSIMTHSFQPVIFYTGLGFFLFLVPKLIKFISELM